jgi:hypothetical protein
MVIEVIPPGGTVDGKDRNHFIKKYWQALCPLPKDSNPAWENTGGKDAPFNANVGEALFMLSFSRKPQASVTRTIQIPTSNKGLFIPIMSVVVSACETDDPLQAVANKDQSSISPPSLSLELDGTPLGALDAYISNPAALGTFSVNFPPPDQAIFTLKNQNQGPCDAVAGGRYVWTKALSPGEHTVNFKGKLRCTPPNCIDEEYMEDITYKINVQ